jgi:hypothetical protein
MESNLFNLKTVSKLTSNAKVTSKQKKAVLEWLDAVEKGELKKEKANYFVFYDLLRDALGYPKKFKSHEFGNVEFPFNDSSGKPLVVVEVKGSKTDLFKIQKDRKYEHRTPVLQTWDYMGQQGFPYGIATNYKEFVLMDLTKGYKKYHYINLEDIRKDKSKINEFIAIFSKDNISKGFITELHSASAIEQREFTKEFYKLYHETRLMLIKEFQDHESVSKEGAIHFAQLYLNRLMFLFFAEDGGLVPENIFIQLISDELKTASLSEHSERVHNKILELFASMNEGSKTYKIYAFNGGLFDANISTKLKFKDLRKDSYFKETFSRSKLKKEIKLNETEKEITSRHKNLSPLIKNLIYLSSFDFNSEVNVEILGHIFEQSISDIEELKNKKESRRKKEGVYYTPEYITEYICRNTIIPYLSKKSTNEVQKLISEYEDDIELLEKKLNEIKIVDPACGSGAFLIKAVEILLEIHKEVQMFKEGLGKYSASKQGNQGEQLTLLKWSDEDKSKEIILKNIHGVDINEESVEITKLSLFLRMAKKGKKLADLSKHIKHGNSLIDDKSVDPQTAFDWDKEFPFKFDIVIGNPPYVRVQNLSHRDIDFFKKRYSFAHRRIDISILFFELALSKICLGGFIGFISSNQFLTAEYGRKIRSNLANNLLCMLDFQDLPIFGGALTYTSIFIISAIKSKSIDYFKFKRLNSNLTHNLKPKSCDFYCYYKIDPGNLTEEPWILSSSKVRELLSKLEKFPKITNLANIKYGIKSGFDKCLVVKIKNKDKNNAEILDGYNNTHVIENDLIIPFFKGKDIKRYAICQTDKSILYPYRNEKGESNLISEVEMKKEYPKTYAYLLKFKRELNSRKDSRRDVSSSTKSWFGLIRFGKYFQIVENKVLTPCVTNRNNFSITLSDRCIYDGGGVYGIYSDKIDLKILLGLLNSNVIEFYLKQTTPIKSGGYFQYSGDYLNKIPIPESLKQEKSLAQRSKCMLRLNKDLQERKTAFLKRLEGNYNLQKSTKKLEKFYKLDENEFLKELQKVTKTNLSLNQQDELAKFFNKYKSKLTEIKSDIDKTDNELNQMVYKLYGLTEKDRNIIEDSLK